MGKLHPKLLSVIAVAILGTGRMGYPCSTISKSYSKQKCKKYATKPAGKLGSIVYAVCELSVFQQMPIHNPPQGINHPAVIFLESQIRFQTIQGIKAD